MVRIPCFHLGSWVQATWYGQKERKILGDIMADQVFKCAKTMLIRGKNHAGWEGRPEPGRPRQGCWEARACVEGVTRQTGQSGLRWAAGRLDTAPVPADSEPHSAARTSSCRPRGDHLLLNEDDQAPEPQVRLPSFPCRRTGERLETQPRHPSPQPAPMGMTQLRCPPWEPIWNTVEATKTSHRSEKGLPP